MVLEKAGARLRRLIADSQYSNGRVRSRHTTDLTCRGSPHAQLAVGLFWLVG